RAAGPDDRALRPLRSRPAEAARGARLDRRLRPLCDARPRHRPGPATALEVRGRRLSDGLSVALPLGRVQPARSELAPRADRRLLASRRPRRAQGPRHDVDPVARRLLADEREAPSGGGARPDPGGAPISDEGVPPLESEGGLHDGSPQVGSRQNRHRRKTVKETYEELKTRLAGIHDLRMARAILGWDQHTKMPPKGGEVRAEQLGTLDRFSHELFISDEVGRVLEDLREYEEGLDADSDEASLIRITRRDYEKAKRVPPELRAEMTRAGAMALPAWIEAREKSDFSIFLPYLKRNVELQHE